MQGHATSDRRPSTQGRGAACSEGVLLRGGGLLTTGRWRRERERERYTDISPPFQLAASSHFPLVSPGRPPDSPRGRAVATPLELTSGVKSAKTWSLWRGAEGKAGRMGGGQVPGCQLAFGQQQECVQSAG